MQVSLKRLTLLISIAYQNLKIIVIKRSSPGVLCMYIFQKLAVSEMGWMDVILGI